MGLNAYYPHLFSPIRVGNLLLKNRICASPTGQISMEGSGHIDVETAQFWAIRAKGGAAVVTVGACVVHPETGMWDVRQIKMNDPDLKPSLARCARLIAHNGAIPSLELAHGGSFSYPITQADGRKVVYGASDGVPGTQGAEVLEMPAAMIEEIADEFGKAALMAKEAGFRMVMLHAAHGWLLSQFLSPVFNTRTDEYGGSPEKRTKFLRLCLERIRKYAGNDMPVELRINGSDFLENSCTLEDMCRVVELVEDQVDLFHVSCGNILNEHFKIRTHPSEFQEDGCNVFLAAEIRKHTGKPVVAVGAIQDPEMMEEIIASGKADMIACGRELIADPYLPVKAMTGRKEDITPCLRCMECLASGQDRGSGVITCSVNPVIGSEWESISFRPVLGERRTVVIAGAGPAGMTAAVTAAKNGHKVILFEKEEDLGGDMRLAGIPDFKYRIRNFTAVLARRLEKSGAELHLNSCLTPQILRETEHDVCIAAVGAHPIQLKLPGAGLPTVRTLEDVCRRPESCGSRTILIGGGLVGTELAISLAKQGKQVAVVELLDRLAAESDPFWVGSALENEIRKYGIQVFVRTAAERITEEGLEVRQDGRSRILKADTVVPCIGFVPDQETAAELGKAASVFYPVGNCVQPRKIIHAVREGYYTALSI